MERPRKDWRFAVVTDIDALNERMQDPQETFTPDEVQALIDWNVRRATTDQYQQARIASMLQATQSARDTITNAMLNIESHLASIAGNQTSFIEVSHEQA